jgi:hypothetical protein
MHRKQVRKMYAEGRGIRRTSLMAAFQRFMLLKRFFYPKLQPIIWIKSENPEIA